MQSILNHPRSAVIASLILCLPVAFIFSLITLGIEPHFGPLQPLFAGDNSRLGSLIALGALLLLPVAFLINLAPVMRDVRGGKSIAANPANLLLAAAILLTIVIIVGAIIVDQYPCWIGVPNCD